MRHEEREVSDVVLQDVRVRTSAARFCCEVVVDAGHRVVWATVDERVRGCVIGSVLGCEELPQRAAGARQGIEYATREGAIAGLDLLPSAHRFDDTFRKHRR
jgi:hypothetical protein